MSKDKKKSANPDTKKSQSDYQSAKTAVSKTEILPTTKKKK